MADNNKIRIEFDRNGEHFNLEFTADSLRRMEKTGFNFGDLDSHALQLHEELFCGLFIEHHSNTPRKKRLEIYEDLTANADEEGDEKGALDDIVMEMFNEAMDEIQNRKTGNVKWKAVR